MVNLQKYEVDVRKLRWYCPNELTFTSTNELKEPSELEDIVKGQESAKKQLRDSIRLKQNAILLGPPGCGKSLLANTLAKQYSAEKQNETALTDQLLAHNFENEFEPLAISLPTSLGKELREELNQLIKNLPAEIAQYHGRDNYFHDNEIIGQKTEGVVREGRVVDVKQSYITRREVTKELEKRKRQIQNRIADIKKKYAKGDRIRAPLNRPHLPVELERILKEAMDDFNIPIPPFEDENDEIYTREELIRKLEDSLERVEEEIKGVTGEKIEALGLIEKLKQKYAKYEKVIKLVDGIVKDAEENIERLRAGPNPMDLGKGDPTEAYKVNLIVDNSETKGLPVQYIENPSLQNMIGDVPHDPLGLGGRKPHMRAKAGKLVKANGGVAIIDEMILLFQDRELSNYFLTCLEEGEVRIGGGRGLYGGGTSAGIETEPVEADCIIIGCANIDIRKYTTEKMARRFKQKIIFDANMPNTTENREAYADFIAYEIRKFNKDEKNKTKLSHFSPDAVNALIEYGARFATRLENKNGRDYLTNILDPMKDIVMQAGLNALDNKRTKVGKEDVLNAIEVVHASALKEQKDYFDKINEGTLLLKTEGTEIGFVNGLVVHPDPFGVNYFGVPARLEAVISAGKEGLVSIAKESNLSGEVFTKGHEVIIGYFKQKYEKAKKDDEKAKVAEYEGRLDFNQVYNPLEGDSASIATVLAFTSALSDIPVRQDIATTGSMNMHGDVQPVGGVNEKIEGFWRLCKRRGLKEQGVIIPKSNVVSLMLDEQLIEDVKAKKFYIYAVDHIDEAIEIATDMPATDVHTKVETNLEKYRVKEVKAN